MRIFVGFVAAILVLTGCSSSAGSSDPGAQVASPSATVSPSVSPVPMPVGEAVTLVSDDLAVRWKVRLCFWNPVIDPDPDLASQPPAGRHIALATFTIDNLNGMESQFSSTVATAIDSKGQRYDATNPEVVVNLGAWQSGSGIAVGFSYPKTVTIAEVQFSAASGAGATGVWAVPDRKVMGDFKTTGCW